MVNIKMGERLKALRQAKRLTLKQVSELLGVSVPVLSAYEIEDRHPSYHILLKLATLYDVSCDYLIRTISKPKNSPSRGLSPEWTVFHTFLYQLREIRRFSKPHKFKPFHDSSF